jgi:hypothetical protein
LQGVVKETLGIDAITAIAKAKSDFQFGKLGLYRGRDFSDSRSGMRGAKYYEADVGEARPSDPLGMRGKRRLVLLADSGRITEMYFSDEHFLAGSWRRILNF